jgi:hypothetical protein
MKPASEGISPSAFPAPGKYTSIHAPGSLTVDAYVTSCLSWNYESRDERMWSLYQRGKSSQWNADSDIDWSPEVSFGAPLPENKSDSTILLASGQDSPVPPALWNRFRWEYQAWMINQFLHGEQGALVTTARLVETVPDLAAKSYAASQVGDEARHVEAYSRYIQEKLGVTYPVSPGLEAILKYLLSESRWDIVYLGMQIIVEGLALAATRVASSGFGDPIIQSISRMIARDEARHISFGIMALDGLYEDMTVKDLSDREDFLVEAIYLMSRRFQLRELWERMDIDVQRGVDFVVSNPGMVAFRHTLFHKLVQALRHLGLLTPRVRQILIGEALVRPGTMDDVAAIQEDRPRRERGVRWISRQAPSGPVVKETGESDG